MWLKQHTGYVVLLPTTPTPKRLRARLVYVTNSGCADKPQSHRAFVLIAAFCKTACEKLPVPKNLMVPNQRGVVHLVRRSTLMRGPILHYVHIA